MSKTSAPLSEVKIKILTVAKTENGSEFKESEKHRNTFKKTLVINHATVHV